MNTSTSSSSRAEQVAAILGLLAVVGCIVTLGGWALNAQRLADWDLDDVAQMPNNAIAVAAAASGLICAVYGKRRMARVLAAFAAVIAAATLFEHVTRIDLGIDTLILYRAWGQRGTVAPGRMGPPASVAILVLGCSIVLLTFPRMRRLATVGGLFTMTVAMLSLIGYVFGADPLFMIPRLTAIALQTSTMLLVLGVAVIAAVPERAPMRLLRGDSAAAMLVRRALPVVVLLPIVTASLLLRGRKIGLFDVAFGAALLVLTLIALLVTLLLWSAAAIAEHERAMRESRDRLAGILGSITDAFVTVDSAWQIVFLNDEAAALLQKPRSALIGRNAWNFLAPSQDQRAHEPLRRAMAERRSVEYESFHPSIKRWFANRAYPTSDGGLAVYSRDITDQKNAQQAIRDSEQKFSLLFEKAAFGAALAKLPDGELIDVNESFIRMFGYSREEAVGKTSFDLGINVDREARARISEQLQREGTIRDLELKLRTRSGEERVFINNITIVELAGEWHLLTTIQDITERKAAEEALQRSTEALIAADRMKDEFLATLSHELRTPLTAIVGWSSMLIDGGLSGRDRDAALDVIRSSAKTQAQLIDDVLDVSRIITGKMRLRREDTDLAAVVEVAAAAVRPAAEAKGIELRLRLDATLPRLFVDAERIRQVVWNLLSNAIKFSGGGTEVEVALRAGDGSYVIEVTDHGQGIARDFLPHVFERFRQADSSATRSHSGLGLGLALSKDLVELHGGTISVESEEGRGSRFTVRLPLPTDREREEGPAVRDGDAAAALHGLRVLFVDDRQDARRLIGTMLRQHGAEVFDATSVEDALVTLNRELPHVVITDLAMPGRDGYDLLAAMRLDSRWDGVPVLALTAQGRGDDEQRAARAGFRAFLRKPIESQQLAAAVAQVVEEQRSAEHGAPV